MPLLRYGSKRIAKQYHCRLLFVWVIDGAVSSAPLWLAVSVLRALLVIAFPVARCRAVRERKPCPHRFSRIGATLPSEHIRLPRLATRRTDCVTLVAVVHRPTSVESGEPRRVLMIERANAALIRQHRLRAPVARNIVNLSFRDHPFAPMAWQRRWRSSPCASLSRSYPNAS